MTKEVIQMFLNIFQEPALYIGIGIALVIIIGIIIFFVISAPVANKGGWANELMKKLIENNIEYKLDNSNNNIYDYKLTIEDKVYLVKLLGIPTYAEVQINNVTTWEVKYGAGKNPSKVQPFKKYVHGIESFMNYKPEDDSIRVVVLSPNAKKITKYINECEIVFVTPKTNVYGIRVINEDDHSLFIRK